MFAMYISELLPQQSCATNSKKKKKHPFQCHKQITLSSYICMLAIEVMPGGGAFPPTLVGLTHLAISWPSAGVIQMTGLAWLADMAVVRVQ